MNKKYINNGSNTNKISRTGLDEALRVKFPRCRWINYWIKKVRTSRLSQRATKVTCRIRWGDITLSKFQ